MHSHIFYAIVFKLTTFAVLILWTTKASQLSFKIVPYSTTYNVAIEFRSNIKFKTVDFP